MPQSTRIPRQCLHCGCPFLAVASEVRRGKAIFCSRRCFFDGGYYTPRRSTQVKRICPTCKTSFSVAACYVRQGADKFCSVRCRADDQVSHRAERVWEKVQKSDGCWLRMGATSPPYGYGVAIGLDGRQNNAHRIVWILTHGPIDEGLEVCHNCPGGDNPRCVRPDHMFLGTRKENAQDMARKGRSRRGEIATGAKLTADRVREIRHRHANEPVTQQQLAREYNVTQGNIHMILSRKTWAHVDP